MPGKIGLHIRIQQEKSYQNDEFFFLGFEKVLKMQASVMSSGAWSQLTNYLQPTSYGLENWCGR